LLLLSKTVLAIKRAFTIAEIDKIMKLVNDEANHYTAIMNRVTNTRQFKREKDLEKEDLLEWIWPKGITYIIPKKRTFVGNTCQWFLRSRDYLNWVGQDSSALSCSGKGTPFRGRPF